MKKKNNAELTAIVESYISVLVINSKKIKTVKRIEKKPINILMEKRCSEHKP